MDDLKLYGSNRNQLDSLIQTVRIFSEDIHMKFGLEKCSILEMKQENKVNSTGIELPDQSKIGEASDQGYKHLGNKVNSTGIELLDQSKIGEASDQGYKHLGNKVNSTGIELPDQSKIGEASDQGYKYLEILQLHQYMHEVMKEKIATGYTKRVKKLCKSSLNAGNLMQDINTWTVSVVRYSAGSLDWTVEELKNLDRMTKKIVTINRCLPSRSNVARLYIPRKQGGRGLFSIEEYVMKEKKPL